MCDHAPNRGHARAYVHEGACVRVRGTAEMGPGLEMVMPVAPDWTWTRSSFDFELCLTVAAAVFLGLSTCSPRPMPYTRSAYGTAYGTHDRLMVYGVAAGSLRNWTQH